MPGYGILTTQHTKSGLICPECGLLVKEAVQTPDGVRLCKSCCDEIARKPGFVNPDTGVNVCGEDGNLAFCYPDKAARREVSELEVQCSNQKYGCSWIGKLGDYIKVHEGNCRYLPQSCPNSCGESFSGEELKKHLELDCHKRNVECSHCGDKMAYDELLNHHDRNCTKFPCPCKLCEVKIPREDIERHVKNECKYIICTCGETLNRDGGEHDPKSVATHLKDPSALLSHLLSVFSHGSQLFNTMDGVGRRLDALEKEVEEGSMAAALQCSQELAQFQKDVFKQFKGLGKQVTTLEQQQLSQASAGDKNVATRLESLYARIQELEKKGTRQTAEIQTLQAQLQQSKVYSTWDTSSSLTSHKYTSSEVGRLANVEKRYEDIERQVTMLKVHVSDMELQLQASLASTYNGSFMWRIPDLAKRRRDAIDGRITSLYSPPFYTAKNGYKMCIRVYLNGDGMGHKTHFSLFFVLMKGEFDALLKWPFENKVSLILVDQNHRKHIVQTFKPTPESSSFQRPISDMNVASGCPQFCKLSYLDDESYTKDDVLFIKCIVDTTHIFHP